MRKVYIISEDGFSEPMTPIYCKDESKELQDILEKNPDLIPGDQISPSDPRRWLLVKKEMPVPDPNTGGSRWNIDFFFVDQDAMPTFIECKRFNDTRARREITGQMLEYAANAHYYWEKDELMERTYGTLSTFKLVGSGIQQDIHDFMRFSGTCGGLAVTCGTSSK